MKSRKLLAAYLKEARLYKQLSQAGVAEELGYTTPQFISNWERGISSPPISAICKLMEVYDLPRSEVIKVMLEEERLNLEQDIKTHRARMGNDLSR